MLGSKGIVGGFIGFRATNPILASEGHFGNFGFDGKFKSKRSKSLGELYGTSLEFYVAQMRLQIHKFDQNLKPPNKKLGF
jgi:hypothetical protein